MKILVKIRIQQFKNILKQANQSGKKKYFIFFLLGAAILFMMTFFFLKVFGFLFHQDTFPLYFKLFLCEKILMLTFLTMFLMMILSALISTLNMFFLSRDLNLLLASPLGSRTVFAWKTIEVSVSSSIIVIFFSLPILFSYTYYFAPNPIKIIAIVSVFLLFMISGVLIGILIGLIVPAFFSVKKLQPVLSLVSILLISGIIIFMRLLRPEQFGNPQVINNLMEYMGGLNVKGFSWFPFYWTAKAINQATQGNFSAYGKEISPFIILIITLTAVLLFLQKKYYRQLVDKLNKTTGGFYHSNWKHPRLLKGKLQDYSTLWKKEIKTFFRSPAQWSQLLIVGAIIIVFIINIKGMPMPHPSVKNIIAYLNLGMAAFVVAGLNSRFTFTTIPMEYPGIIHLLASPFKKEKLYRFKLVFFAIPQLIIGFILFIAGDISLHLDSFARITGIVFLLPILPSLTVLALFYSLKIEEAIPLSPQHLIASKNGISYMLWSLVLVIAGMIYFIRPVFIYYYSDYMKHPTPTSEILLWFAGFVLLNLAMITIFHKRNRAIWKRKEFTVSY